MTATDRHALEMAEAVRRLGLTPGREIDIVGYDNSYPFLRRKYPACPPPAATMDKNNGQIGRALCQLLLDRLEGRLPPEPQLRRIDPTLVVPGEAFTEGALHDEEMP
ncbi:MAG: substrate-binding domain-containing protein [Phycisphaerae bacterium]